jgi:hypothetical protein
MHAMAKISSLFIIPSCWDKLEHLISHAQANSSLQASSALLSISEQPLFR